MIRGPVGAPRSPFGGFFWIALLGFFALAGVGLQEVVGELPAGWWPQLPCEILRSGAAESPVSYSLPPGYNLRWGGDEIGPSSS